MKAKVINIAGMYGMVYVNNGKDGIMHVTALSDNDLF